MRILETKLHIDSWNEEPYRTEPDGRKWTRADVSLTGSDGVCATTKSPADATIAMLDALLTDDAELVTLVVGAGADGGDTARIAEHLELTHPDVEIEVHEGDQPLYPYLVGVE